MILPPTSSSPLAARGGALFLTVRLQPGARRDALLGVETLADGTCVLKAAVSAPPEGGKANAALVTLLAKTLKLPKSGLSLAAGQRSRLKVIGLGPDGPGLRARLAALLETAKS